MKEFQEFKVELSEVGVTTQSLAKSRRTLDTIVYDLCFYKQESKISLQIVLTFKRERGAD